MSFWWSNIFTVFFIYQTVSAKCLEHDYEIQDYLISSKPPWDNYYNISKAVYPSIDLPSLLLKITVEFLSTATGVIQNASTTSNTSAASINQSESDTRLILQEIKMYTWSMSCLYVSAGDVSLFAMMMFSLGTIWPSRRERQLRIKLPEFCHGVPQKEQKEQMEYFLSTLQDVAIRPTVADPSLNTVECVTEGHGKAPAFPGVKQLLHRVCWCLLSIALVMSTLASQWLMVWLREEHSPNNNNCKSKAATVLLLLVALFIMGLGLLIFAICKNQGSYLIIFLVVLFLVFSRRLVWCLYQEKNRMHLTSGFCSYWRNRTNWKFLKRHLDEGHETCTSTNVISCFIVYPALFMTFHHLLWILLGMITEPFWAFPVLVALISVSAVFYLLVYEIHEAVCAVCRELRKKKLNICLGTIWAKRFLFVSCFLTILALFLFVLLVVILLVVGQAFLSESLIANVVQSGLFFVITICFKYVKPDNNIDSSASNSIDQPDSPLMMPELASRKANSDDELNEVIQLYSN